MAREIYSFPIPTISGVGHEIDFTICDFVADIRVPTPTASAELVTEFIYQVDEKLKNNKTKLYKNIKNIFEEFKQFIDLNNSKLKNPIIILREKYQRLDNIDIRLQQNQKSIMLNKTNEINILSSMLNNKNPLSRLLLIKEKIGSLLNDLNRGIQHKFKASNNYLDKLYKNIKILDPLSILDRGYAIVTNAKGVALKSSKVVNKGESLKARLAKGSMNVEVKNIND